MSEITDSEMYNHSTMTTDDLEARIAADLYELHMRLLDEEKTKHIGNLMWGLMKKIREAYRTAKLMTGEN